MLLIGRIWDPKTCLIQQGSMTHPVKSMKNRDFEHSFVLPKLWGGCLQIEIQFATVTPQDWYMYIIYMYWHMKNKIKHRKKWPINSLNNIIFFHWEFQDHSSHWTRYSVLPRLHCAATGFPCENSSGPGTRFRMSKRAGWFNKKPLERIAWVIGRNSGSLINNF